MARRYATTKQRGLGWEHVKDKERLLALHRDGEPCWRCGQPMFKSQGLERDHVIDRVLGGIDGPAVLAHASCNRSAGARLGNQRRPRPIVTAHAPPATCKTCRQTYHYAARACGVCGMHYHPSYGEQRTCSRACGVALRRQVYGTAGSSPDPGLAERQAQRQRERQEALAARDEQAARRAQRIRELRVAGMCWADIATAVGLAGPGAAYNAADPVRYREYLRAQKQQDGQPLAARW
jgi:hypothetical protein